MEIQEQFHAHMFGTFQFIGENGVLNDETLRSEMLTRLLAYLLVNRKRALSVSELTDILWGDDENTDNPAGALKNLMYRLRTVMKKTLGDLQYIITGHGSYYWNQELEVHMDSEDFDRLGRQAEQASAGTEERIQALKDSLDLYEGTFLKKLAQEHWVMPLSTYYHSQYLIRAKELAVLYEENKQYSPMASVCRNAIDVDNLDEELHYLFVKALIGQGEKNLAMEHYRKATNILYENLGTKPSEKLRDLYQQLLEDQHDIQDDLETIQEEMIQEKENPQGAFLCEYGVFKEIYRLELRRVERLGISEYIVLLTIEPKDYISREEEAYLRILSDAVNNMQDVLCTYLRSVDVASRYSGSQFVVMLPTCTFEAAKMVTGRILSRFYAKEKFGRVKVQYSLEEVSLTSIMDN